MHKCWLQSHWLWATSVPQVGMEDDATAQSAWYCRKCHSCSSASWSLQKSDRERFAQVAHDKRATGAIRSFSLSNHSFAHKKWANRSKNRWANSQPKTKVKSKIISLHYSSSNILLLKVKYFFVTYFTSKIIVICTVMCALLSVNKVQYQCIVSRAIGEPCHSNRGPVPF